MSAILILLATGRSSPSGWQQRAFPEIGTDQRISLSARVIIAHLRLCLEPGPYRPWRRYHYLPIASRAWSVDQLPDGKRGSYCPPVQAFDGLSERVAVPASICLRHSASVSGVRVIQSRAPGPRRAVRVPSLIQV